MTTAATGESFHFVVGAGAATLRYLRRRAIWHAPAPRARVALVNVPNLQRLLMTSHRFGFSFAISLFVAAPLAYAQQPATDVAHYDVYTDGDAIHLLVGYGRKGEPAIALFHRRSTDGGTMWSAPIRVNRDADRLSAHHPGENPQIVAMGDRLVVVWTAPRAGARRGGLIATMVSNDGGKTWQDGPAPYHDAQGSQTFMELLAAGKTVHMVWLDSRDRQQSLRYAQSADAGATWSADRSLAPKTCDCCWNSLAAAPDGAISVLFRGAEPRDMMHVISRNGTAWRHTGSIGNFDWRIQGCPHVGGALAHNGQALHSLTWTGKEGGAGLYYSWTTDAGNTWSTPLRMGSEHAKNADLAAAPDGSLAAIWDEHDGKAGAIFTSRSKDGGGTWTKPERVVGAGRSATNPRIATTRHGTANLWLEGSPWRGGTLKVNGRDLPAPAAP
jgi:hypothetical protein